MGVKFGTEEGPSKFHPHRCNVSPLRGDKPQNRPLTKLNTGRFALRAMLPVMNIHVTACVQSVHHHTHDLRRWRHWSIAASITSCSKSNQVCIKRFCRSSMSYKSLDTLLHNTTRSKFKAYNDRGQL